MFRIIRKNVCQRTHVKYSSSYLTIQNYTTTQKPNLSNSEKSVSVTYLNKYVIHPYVQMLEKKFPKTVHLYKTLHAGITGFYNDLKQSMKLHRKIRKQGIYSLSRDELQLIVTMSNDTKKIVPIILMSIVPFTNYIIVPLAFYFPDKFLTSHFWTTHDKKKFMLKDHKERSEHNQALLKYIANQLDLINDQKLLTPLNKVIKQLKNGTSPLINDVVNCKKFFSGPPFSLNCIKRKHAKQLLKIHGMSSLSFRYKYRLFQRGLIIKHWDIAIEREGGVAMLTEDAIQWALSCRGLNPVNMSIDSMQIWLKQWLIMSSLINTDHISLLLHYPIFLAYNHKNKHPLAWDDHKKINN